MLNSDRRQQKEFTGITKAPAGLAIDNLSATKLADLSVGRKSSRLEFLREINHKLSQPATSLRFCLEFALQDDGEKLKRAVENALRITDNLIELLNAMRELTEAQDPGECLEVVDANRLARTALSMSGLPAKKFSWQNAGNSAACVRVHPGRMERALINIFVEVVEDSKGSEPVSVELIEQEDTVNISCVYEAGEQARDPERFFLPFAARGSKLDSRALGVAISQGIAEAAGGSLKLTITGSQRKLTLSLQVQANATEEGL